MKENWELILWVAVVGAIFAYLWHQGHLKRLARYVQETRQELLKCTWPSKEELKGSTVVVIVAFALMSGFTVLVDVVVAYVVRQLI